MLVLAFAFVLAITSTSAAALNETSNQTNISATANADYSGSDPIISGTVTVNEYDHVRPLEGASVIVNSTSGNVLASTTTDANGHYSLNFFSTDTTFNVIVSYIGCNSITHSVTVTNGPNYPTDPNKYGTSNFELTPKEATLTGTGNGQTVYIQGQNKNGFAGVIDVRVGSTTYTAYCIDLFTPISIGDTLLVNGPLPGTAGDLPSEVDWGKVSYILNTYNPSSDTEAAAIQCAIWYFTSVHYGPYNPSAPIGTYYQYMTAPNDGRIGGASGSTTVRTRAWEIINAAISMQYPYSIEVTPEQTTVANDQTVTITATVRDINGNPLQGVTVNFQKTLGSLSRNSGITNALGQVSTILTLWDNSNSMVTAYVSGNYGNLLYDDATATTRKQNLVARNVLPLTISAFSIINTARTADVTLTQTATPATVNVGDTVTYVVTATNANQRTATGIMISDIIPAGLSGVTVTASSGTTYYNGVWTIPTLNKLTSATLTITGIATAQMAGLTTTNTATRIAQEQYNSMPASVSAGVYTKKADVAVTQTVNGGSSATANVGDTITYVINAVNNGPDAATNLRITDLLPSGLTDRTYTITGPGTYNLGTGLWNIGTLNSGATAILTITGKITAAMAGLTTTNYATRTAQTEYNPSPASTSTTVYTKLSDPIITQTVNGQNTGTVNVNVGNDVTFVVNAYCSGPDDATNIQIRDIVPAGLTNVTVTPSVGTYDSNTGIWTIPFLEKYTSATLTITGKAGTSMAGTSITNRAQEIYQTEYNPAPGDSTSISVYTKMADVTLTQTGSYQSNVVTFIVTATNNGPDTATNINIEDIIPDGLTGITVTPSAGTSYADGVWTIPSLAYLANATLNITGTVVPQTTTTNNATRISQTEYNSEPAENSSNVYVPTVNLYVTNYPWKSGTYTYSYKQQIVMLTQVNNLGNTTATGITVIYVIGDAFKVVSYNLLQPGTGTLYFDEETNTFTWTIDYLDGGNNTQKGSFTGFSVLLESLISGSGTPDFALTSSIVSCDQTNIGTTKSRTRNLIINPSADIQINQTVSNTNPNTGDYITITITAKNNGPNTATGITITDLLPTELYLDPDTDPNTSYTTTEGTYNPTTGIWTITNLNNDTEATLTIIARIDAAPETSFANRAYRSGTPEQYDWNTGNDANNEFITNK